jgi:hypothetical protein
MDLRKTLVVALLLLSVISLALGQPTAGGGGPGDMVFDSIDGIVAGEVNSWMDLFLVVIFPLLGVYAISRYMTGKAFEIAEDQFRDNQYGSTELGSTEKRLAQFVSISIAAPTVMFFGGVIPFFSLLLTGIAVIWFFWQFVGGGLMTRWRSSSNGESGTSTEATQEVQQARDEAQTIRGALKNRAQDEVISRIESGNDDNPDQDAREVAEEIEEELDQLLQAEKDLSTALEDEYGDLRLRIRELEQHVNDEREDEEELEQIKQLEDYCLRILRDSQENFQNENLVQVENDIREMMNRVAKMKTYTDRLRLGVEEENDLLTDEEENLLQDLENLAETHELINFFLQAEEKLEEEDEELEKIAKKFNDRELMQKAEEEEQEEVQLEKLTRNLEKHERETEKTFEKAENLLDQILRLDKAEINQIKSELQEDSDLYGEIDEMIDVLEGNARFDSEERATIDPDSIDINEMADNADSYDTVNQLRAIKVGLGKIRENLEYYADYASSEMDQVDRLQDKIESILHETEEDSARDRLNSILS